MQLSSYRALRLCAAALLFLSTFNVPLFAQRPPAQPNAAEILHKMQKLNVLGSVLYIVAHPDDENTRLIAWLANGKKVRTGNLSLTRGDGGQNLIGPELGDALGIIRTQELLEARRIDGGEQFFTRAVDFGFSKNAAESFEKWGKQEVLSDVVRVIRMFRPDVIITRFAPDRSAGHGHHEASAILAEEAFDLAGDPKAFPEQLEQGLEVWQPRRLFFNGSTWWKKDLAEIAKNDPDWFSVDVGGYDPLLGLSYTEIAGRSRSMHKSQGFGAAETRGEQLEYLKLVKGDRPKTKDIFEGIDMTWGRVPEGTMVESAIDALKSRFDLTNPTASVDEIGVVSKALPRVPSDKAGLIGAEHWYEKKRQELNSIFFACLGMRPEALSLSAEVSLHDSLNIAIETLSRVGLRPAVDVGLTWAPDGFNLWSIEGFKSGPSDGSMKYDFHIIPKSIHEPFWLTRSHAGLYDVPPSLVGWPVSPFGYYATVSAKEATSGQVFGTSERLYYKWVDRVAGERIRPVYITPVASVIPKSDVLIATGGPQTITVEVEALTDSLVGSIAISMPDGWRFDKTEERTVMTLNRRERASIQLTVHADDDAISGFMKFTFESNKGRADRTLHEIDYPHIMPQVYYTPAEVKLVPLDVTTTAKRVGYVKGAGDDVPQAMEQLGVVVEFIEPASAKLEELKKYDAIVTGIRAYNATKGMKELHPLLLRYVEEGGTLIVQYNTTPRFFSGASDFQIDPATLGPKPFSITRDRVTVEEAPPTFLDPKHPLLTTPNTITAADFEGWVQERGLYFAGDLGTNYTPLIAWNDPGEQPLTGGLITCDHGKGRFIYTGISFFRQLPAGVPGAYRLFANLISPRDHGNK